MIVFVIYWHVVFFLSKSVQYDPKKETTLAASSDDQQSLHLHYSETQKSSHPQHQVNSGQRIEFHSAYVGNIIQLLTGFEDNSSFVWPEDGSVVRNRRLRATDLFEGQTKLLLSSNPVYNCFVIHLHFFPKFSYSLFPLAYQYPSPWNPRIWTTPLYIVTSISRDELNQWK